MNKKAATTGPSLKPTETEKVDLYMKTLSHPLTDLVEALRQAILTADKNIGEEIAWNAPCFFHSGLMDPGAPKEYKRVIVVFNFLKKDSIRLVFLKGVLVNSPLLEGDYKDGRRLMSVHSADELKKNKKELQRIVKEINAKIPGL